MSALGVGEILAISSIIFQVITSVQRVVGYFDSIQNAPKQLRAFYNSINRLDRNFKDLGRAANDTGSIITGVDREEITTTLKEYVRQFSDCEITLRQTLGAVIWPIHKETQVEESRKEIDRIYLEIVQPAWAQLISKKLTELGRNGLPLLPAPQTGTHSNRISLSEMGCVVVHRDQTSIAGSTIIATGVPVPEKKLREVEESTRRYRTICGLPMDDLPDIAITVDWPPAFDHLPTTLVLNSPIVPMEYRTLKLVKVQIMSRNERSRILHYLNEDESVRVKHVVPLESIPWTEDKSSREVTFLETHFVTVIDHGMHHLYPVLNPKYIFGRGALRRQFQSVSRERRLLKEFYAIKISSNAIPITLCEVIRFWGKDEPRQLPTVTMTFLASSIGDRKSHKEWDITDFSRELRFVYPILRGLTKPQGSKTLKLQSLRSSFPAGTIHIEFHSMGDAQEFKTCFENVYPRYQNTGPPQIDWTPPNSMSSSTRNSATTSSDLQRMSSVSSPPTDYSDTWDM